MPTAEEIAFGRGEQWEYHFEPLDMAHTDIVWNRQLNVLGREAWELVTIFEGVAVLKRRGYGHAKPT